MLQLLHEKVIHFNGSILGFEEYDEFIFSFAEEDSPYAYLQSLKDDNIGFLLVIPFVFYSDYAFEVDDKDKAALGIVSEEEVAAFTIVTIREPFTKSSTNLLAPIVVNTTSGQARQVVLPPRSNYSTNEPLFKDAHEESGD
ncbi:flagellar assembly protein FliW [Paenibacillus alginolyticus]|uniref:flagellar assembly protein FliW n=1 Tax=Paenibacillus alginolyticus TaxID=59839 RepID=UPI00040C5AF4|nr:flagellar assembly protein FliW [Paenibacillus alginolyticus]MCY9665106.1 flagellar assembly protein FliW [Paenibacillus alginolyticus]